MAKGNSPKGRVFFIMQYEHNPRTGEPLIDEQQIQRGLQYRSIKDWGYIRHDKDTYSVEDEEREREQLQIFRNLCMTDQTLDQKKNAVLCKLWQIEDKEKAIQDAFSLDFEEFARRYQRQKAGTVKAPHYHIAVRCENAVEINSVARWFGVPPQYVEIARSKDKKNNQGAFMDCMEYLTHESEKEQRLGKHLYDNSEVHANFDWRTALDERKAKRAQYGRDLSAKDEIRHKVLYEGLSIAELCSTPDGQLAYMDDSSTLDKFRLKYIQERAPMPTKRTNYYIFGDGGMGKNLMCKAIARAMFPHITHEEDIFFEVGANKATFDGYDGQPVIIWNDFRAPELLSVLGGRGNVFRVFETFPSGRGRQNIKYGSVTLTNEVNLVNSVQEYSEFLDGLAGDYTKSDGSAVELAEDKGQSYRRFPFILPLRESDFDLLLNKGVMDGTREYMQYYEYKGIQGNMQRIASMLSGDVEKRRIIEAKTVKPIVDKYQQLTERLTTNTMTDSEIEETFGAYGTQGELCIDIDDNGEQVTFFDTHIVDTDTLERHLNEEQERANAQFEEMAAAGAFDNIEPPSDDEHEEPPEEYYEQMFKRYPPE